jgi:hypothetical protein
MSEYNINAQFTLAERAKRLGEDGKTAAELIDVLEKRGTAALIKDVPFVEANMGLKHRVLRTVSRPASTRRKFYAGVGPTMTTSQVIWEDVVLLEQRSEIDEDQLDTLPVAEAKEVRRQEDEMHIAGLDEDFANALFNDARTSGAEYIDGFAARLGTLSYPGHSTTSLPYCYTMGGSTALTSIYIVEYGRRACYGIYPPRANARDTVLGLAARDKGKEARPDSDDSTKTWYGYVSQFKRWIGMACENDAKIVRIANVESGRDATYGVNEDILIEALNHGKFNRSKTRIYVNPYLQTQIDIRAKNKGVGYSVEMVFGEPILTFWKVPIRVIDDTIIGIAETEVA